MEEEFSLFFCLATSYFWKLFA